MDNPSILHIDTGHAFRGGQRQVYLLTRELQKHYIRQVLACPQGSQLARRISDIPVILMSRRSLFRKLFAGRLETPLESLNLNIIHAHDSEAHTIGLLLKRRLRGIKLVVSRRVTFAPSSRASVRHKYLGDVDCYLAISRAVADSLKSLGIPDERIEIIPSGLDLDTIRRVVKDAGVYSEISNRYEIVIVTAGALTEEKDFFTAIDAFAIVAQKMPRVAMLVFGEGPMRPKLEERIARRNLENIFLMGFQEPLAPIFKTADLFLLTSRSEGLNSAAIEAAACGLPLVVSDAGGLPELVEPGYNGYLCPPGDSEAFARAVVSLFSDEDKRRSMSANAEIKAGQFDIGDTARKTRDLYERLLVK